MARSLGDYAEPAAVEAFKNVKADNVADFCLELYRAMGMLDGVRVVRSGDPAVREAACDIDDFYVDVPCEGETVRARRVDGELKLHHGGSSWRTLPPCEFSKAQISPARDTRLGWMQSVLHCSHYIAGAGEQAYLRQADAPDITFVGRDEIENSSEAYAQLPI